MNHPISFLNRHRTTPVKVGSVIMGGNAPVVVQSMTNTDTTDIAATVKQVIQLAQAGSEIVRITVNTMEAAQAVPRIKEQLERAACYVPLVGDFHFNGHKLLAAEPACAQALAKYRINPGNVGKGSKRDSQFAEMIELACRYEKPVRIGVNGGSLDQALLARLMDKNSKQKTPKEPAAVVREALVISAIESAQQAEILGLKKNQIIISCKVSNVQELIGLYQDLAGKCNYALHLGLTEAGMGSKGIVSSTCALAVLLQQGIGDTIRLSLTPEPGGPRTEEVRVAQEILQSLGLRSFIPSVIACPGCGRTTSTVFQKLAKETQDYLAEHMPSWRKQYPGVENMTLAVMGCVVNGPGESKHVNIGISLPGTGEHPVAPVYVDGQKTVTLKGDNIAQEFQSIMIDYIKKNYTHSV